MTSPSDGEENIEVESNSQDDNHINVEEGFGVRIPLQRCNRSESFVLFMSCTFGFFGFCVIATEPRVESL